MDRLGRRALRRRQRPLLRDGPRPRWDRTKLAYDAIVHGEGFRRRRPGRRAGGLRARRDRRVHAPDGRRPPSARRACARATSACSSTSAPTAPASSRAPSPSRTSTSSTAAPAPPAVDFVTMTQYKKEFPLPVAFAAERPRRTSRRGARRRRAAPAPHRRDREVRPRHLLLQRRRRAGVPGRDARPRAQPARRARPTTTSRR